ncbi:MAG TPA: hypothetical protein VML94_00100 [Thermoplasmata archaeon]|nr:hypothetical protein [Thermoplasmata archaeon]
MAWTYEITVRARFPGLPELEYIESQTHESFVTPSQAAGQFLTGFTSRFGSLNPKFVRIRLVETGPELPTSAAAR